MEVETLMQLVDDCDKADKIGHTKLGVVQRSVELAELGFGKLAANMTQKANRKEQFRKIYDFKYIKITPDKIKSFLKRKVDAYNLKHKKTRKDSKSAYYMHEFDQAVRHLYSNNIDDALSYRMRSIEQQQRMYAWPDLAGDSASQFFDTGIASIAPSLGEPTSLQESTCNYNNSDKNTIGSFVWEETRIESYETLPPDNVLKTLKEHKERQVFNSYTIATVKGIHDPLLLGRVNDCEDRYFIAQWGEDISLDDVI